MAIDERGGGAWNKWFHVSIENSVSIVYFINWSLLTFNIASGMKGVLVMRSWTTKLCIQFYDNFSIKPMKYLVINQ